MAQKAIDSWSNQTQEEQKPMLGCLRQGLRLRPWHIRPIPLDGTLSSPRLAETVGYKEFPVTAAIPPELLVTRATRQGIATAHFTRVFPATKNTQSNLSN